jgi:hypothetical protein
MATTLTPTFRPRTTWSASLDVARVDHVIEYPQCPPNGGLPDSLAIAGVTTFLTVRFRADGPSGPSSRHRSYSRPC